MTKTVTTDPEQAARASGAVLGGVSDQPKTMPDPRITEETVAKYWRYHLAYLVEMLNGQYSVEEAREDFLSIYKADHVKA